MELDTEAEFVLSGKIETSWGERKRVAGISLLLF